MAVVCSCVTGCPAQWNFIFINDDRVPLLIQAGGDEMRLAPGQRWRTRVPDRHVGEEPLQITVRETDGTILCSVAVDDVFFVPAVPAEYPNRFVGVTRSGISAIPDPKE